MLLEVLQQLDIPSLSFTFVYYNAVLLGVFGFVFLACFSIAKIRSPTRNLHRIGIGSKSNLRDQYDARYTNSEGFSDKRVYVKALYIHPIKSCKPIEVERIQVTKIGFAYDRCFAIANEAKDESSNSQLDWRFISQRTKPQMSQIETELWFPRKQSELLNVEKQTGGSLVVKFPNPDTSTMVERLRYFFETGRWFNNPPVQFVVPLFPTATLIDKYAIQLKAFGIHGRTAHGLDLGTTPSVAAALPKLKTFLRIPQREKLTLFRCTPKTLTETTKDHAPLSDIGTPAVHGYTDQQPIHIATLSSTHALSSILPPENQPLNALRFRANMYVVGTPAYVEESWKRYQILPKSSGHGPRIDVATRISVVCRTSRCTMPNVDPHTGIVNRDNPPEGKKKGQPQPSTTLVAERMVETDNPSALGYFGMHCVPEDSSLKQAEDQNASLFVEVGDEIEVLERR